MKNTFHMQNVKPLKNTMSILINGLPVTIEIRRKKIDQMENERKERWQWSLQHQDRPSEPIDCEGDEE